MKKLALIFSLFFLFSCTKEEKNLKFVSFPDFFNFDIPEPWPQYDDAVDYFLGEVKKEDPAFIMVDGDLVDGHWWDGENCVETMGAIYYQGWIRRMNQHGLKYYTAIGDHELGDDPWPHEKAVMMPLFEKAYTDNLKMPQNGPEYKKGLAYYVREGDLLLITVETFELIGDSVYTAVMGDQLTWFNKVLEDNADAKFKIVQGHIGLWGGDTIKSRSSSRIMHLDGKNSEFYKSMIKHDVDAYLVGEFHDVTVLESEGLWQIVHGSSWGRKIVNTQDYLVGEIIGDELHLTLKRIFMNASGKPIYNLNKPRGPLEKVEIDQRTLENGPEVSGTLVIKKSNGKKEFLNQTGYFDLK